MSEWGDTLPVQVWINPRMSHSGKGHWKMAQIDACLAPAVRYLQAKGVNMVASCCGHGKAPPRIVIAPIYTKRTQGAEFRPRHIAHKQ
jgi:hypothetical protein